MTGEELAKEMRPRTFEMDAVGELLKSDRWQDLGEVSFKIHDGKDAPRRDLPFFSRRNARCVIGPVWTTMYFKNPGSTEIECLDSVKTLDTAAVRRMSREVLNHG